MAQEQYYAFVEDLAAAELSPIKDFEEDMYFEGCLPVETIARRGKDTLRFGPMKPVGLPDPAPVRSPYAVVQLRQDDAEGRLYNIVGFQTRLKWGEQRRVFRTIPGMENADFARMGVMHRNTYLPANRMLEATMSIRGELSDGPCSSPDSLPASRATQRAPRWATWPARTPRGSPAGRSPSPCRAAP